MSEMIKRLAKGDAFITSWDQFAEALAYLKTRPAITSWAWTVIENELWKWVSRNTSAPNIFEISEARRTWEEELRKLWYYRDNVTEK